MLVVEQNTFSAEKHPFHHINTNFRIKVSPRNSQVFDIFAA